MLRAILTSKTLTADDILPDLALALACYGVGDGSGIEEWYEPLYNSGEIKHLIIYLKNRPYVLKSMDYTDLATMPHICVYYKNEWIGDQTVADEFKFIYDESGTKPKLLQLTQVESVDKTTVFSDGE